ncbi:MAG: hypothetical protein QNK20_16660 [Aureibaculum sp.]|nr:hypothetical protein [Aureibaculum sp.]
MDYKDRLKVAEWLNRLGYQLDVDETGLWLKDNDFIDHNNSDIVDIILAYSEQSFNK